MNEEAIFNCENRMWKAAQNKNAADFLSMVAEDAIMVCGGYRCSGKEYADIISVFDCKQYVIENFEVNQDKNSVQVHYTIHLEVNDENNADLDNIFWARI